MRVQNFPGAKELTCAQVKAIVNAKSVGIGVRNVDDQSSNGTTCVTAREVTSIRRCLSQPQVAKNAERCPAKLFRCALVDACGGKL